MSKAAEFISASEAWESLHVDTMTDQKSAQLPKESGPARAAIRDLVQACRWDHWDEGQSDNYYQRVEGEVFIIVGSCGCHDARSGILCALSYSVFTVKRDKLYRDWVFIKQQGFRYSDEDGTSPDYLQLDTMNGERLLVYQGI